MRDKEAPRVIVSRRDLMKTGAAMLAASSLAGVLPARAAAKRIGVAQPDRTADLYHGLITAVKDEAAKRGYEILESFTGSTPEGQMAEINAWIAGGVDALVVLPNDPHAIGGVVQKCKEKGIVFVGYANEIPGADGYLKWDDPQAGTAMGGMVAKHIKEKLGGKAEIGLLTLPTNQATRDRIGFSKEAIQKELPDVVFYETQAVLAPDGLRATQSLLQAHPDMKIVICCADDGALGARSAYMNSGLSHENVFLCGFDGSKQNLTLMKEKDNFIRANAALDITEVGHMVVEVPDNIFKKSGPAQVNMPYVMLDENSDVAVIDRLLKAYDV